MSSGVAYEDPLVTLYLGDCLDVMRELPDASVDSVVTDPPYGLEFMGKAWDAFRPEFGNMNDKKWAGKGMTRKEGKATDGRPSGVGSLAGATPSLTTSLNLKCRACGHWQSGGSPCRCETPDWEPRPNYRNKAFQAWCEQWATEAFRVLKPGGYLLAFGGTRTVHRLASAIEDAGFEIRDTLAWLYASGFPKSLSVHKATLKLVESRYAEQRCDCLDSRDGRPARDDAGREGGGSARSGRGAGKVSTDQAGHPAIPPVSRAGDDSVRDVRHGDGTQGSGRASVEAAVLFEDMRGSGAEEAGHRHAPLRAGMEERPGEDPSAGQGVPVVRDDARGERGRPASASPQALPVGGIESPDESGGVVSELPPHDRSRDDLRLRLDTDRREPRRVIPDDQVGRQGAVVRVCSWCGLPDEDYIRSLEPLGTAMKPAMEPIVMARKPLVGTVAANVTRYGTGALNIDGTRIPSSAEDAARQLRANTPGAGRYAATDSQVYGGGEGLPSAMRDHDPSAGRWPSNVLLSDAELFDEPNPWVVGSGATDVRGAVSNSSPNGKDSGIYGKFGGTELRPGPGDSGGYSRFFLIPKADRAERERGLAGHDKRHRGVTNLNNVMPGEYDEFVHPAPDGLGAWLANQRKAAGLTRRQVAAHFPSKTGGLTGCVTNWEEEYNRPTPDQWRKLREVIGFDDRYDEVMTDTVPVERKLFTGEAPPVRANVHPTVKPIDLMRHLVRLVTPPGGVTLDPFLGSGTTALAASEEGFRCIGIEREAEYLEIAKGRLMATPMGLGLDVPASTKRRADRVDPRGIQRTRDDNKIWDFFEDGTEDAA